MPPKPSSLSSENEQVKAYLDSLSPTTNIWEDEPPSPFDEFVTSPKHLNYVPLSDRQYEACFSLLYSVPYHAYRDGEKINVNIFENGPIQQAVLEWGKGSGKDMIASLVLAYVDDVLLRLKYPQAIVGLPPDEAIDTVNVAYSSAQAVNVFFTKYRTRILKWDWLRKKYKIRLSGKPYNPGEDIKIQENEVLVNTNSIIFPKMIRSFSKHSEEESYEGLNPICWILDEASAFRSSTKTRNAKKVYNVLNSSAVTRYGTKAKGMILSYPRYRHDFTEELYDLSQSGKADWLYGDKAATWEMKPRNFFSKETFIFEGREIPIDFKKDFENEPTDSKTKYLCLPPETESPFFEYPERVDLVVSDKPMLFTLEDHKFKGMVSKSIKSWVPGYRPAQYVIGGDLGLTNCESSLCVAHRDIDTLVIDFLDSWIPDKEHIVDINNVQQIIEAIGKKIAVVKVRFDHWNSALLVQNLKSHGFDAQAIRMGYPDIKRLQDMIYQQRVVLPNNPKLLDQIKSLTLLTDNKVDKGEDTKKDLWDAICQACKCLFGDGTISNEEGEFIASNLSTEGGVFLLGDISRKS